MGDLLELARIAAQAPSGRGITDVASVLGTAARHPNATRYLVGRAAGWLGRTIAEEFDVFKEEFVLGMRETGWWMAQQVVPADDMYDGARVALGLDKFERPPAVLEAKARLKAASAKFRGAQEAE